MKKLIILTLVLFFASGVFAAMDPARGYCEHQDYFVNEGICEFGDGSSCSIYDFYSGDCGQEYIKEISCRKQNEIIFSQFEECCDGLSPYLASGMVGQPSCQPFSVRVSSELKYNPIYWLIGIILIIVVIWLIIRKTRKK